MVHPWLMGVDLKGQPLAQALILDPTSNREGGRTGFRKPVFMEALLRQCAECYSHGCTCQLTESS